MNYAVHPTRPRPAAWASRLLTAIFLAALMLAVPAGGAYAQEEQEGQPGIGIAGFTAPDGRGAGVSTVVPGYGAHEAGLRTGDIITEVEGTEIDSIEQLAGELGKYEAGDTVSITFERGEESQTVDVTLRSLPGSTRGSPPPLFGDEGFRGEAQPEPEPGDDDLGYLPVVFMFGVLITGFLATLLVLRLKDRRKGLGGDAAAAGNPVEVARMRYARGEITRAEFLTIAADLGEEGPVTAEAGAAGAAEPEAAGEEPGSEPKDSG